MKDLRAAAEKLDRAIVDAGPAPDYHHDQIDRLRREWPTLWDAIEQVRAAL